MIWTFCTGAAFAESLSSICQGEMPSDSCQEPGPSGISKLARLPLVIRPMIMRINGENSGWGTNQECLRTMPVHQAQVIPSMH